MLLGATPAVAANETVLYYDDGQAAEYTSAVSSAVDVWNSAVDNVRLEPVPDGQHAEILIIADDDWPRAHLGPVRPGGQVTVWMGRQAPPKATTPCASPRTNSATVWACPTPSPAPAPP